MRPLDRFCVIDTDNAQEYRELLSDKFDASRFDCDPRPQRFGVRINYIDLAAMGVGYCDHPAACQMDFRASDIIRYWIVLRGQSEVLTAGNHSLLTAGDTCIADGGSATAARLGNDFSQFALRMKRSTLKEKLRALTGLQLAGDIRFEQGRANAEEEPGLRRAIHYLASELDSAQTAASIGARELEQMILLMFLRASRHTFSATMGIEPKSIAPWQVRIAEEFIEASWQQAITIERLAEVTQVSARSLFEYFRSCRGYSPMAFVRRIRLENARRLLTAADSSTSVIGVALHCGFMNAGHFSRHYKTAFGELPSATVLRSLARRSGKSP